MGEFWALVLIASVMLPCAKRFVEAITYTIFCLDRPASASEIVLIWLPTTLIFWAGLLA